MKQFHNFLLSFNTQAEAADFLGVTQGTISHWLTGRRVPGRSKAVEIIEKSRDRGRPLKFEHIYGRAA